MEVGDTFPLNAVMSHKGSNYSSFVPDGAHTEITGDGAAHSITYVAGASGILIENTGASADARIRLDGTAADADTGFVIPYAGGVSRWDVCATISVYAPLNSTIQYQWFK